VGWFPLGTTPSITEDDIMSNPNDPTKPDADQADDPNRDRDKPKYPAPAGGGESGTSRNPQGASGPPPTGPLPGQPIANPVPNEKK
jgi:hypothetical protein